MKLMRLLAAAACLSLLPSCGSIYLAMARRDLSAHLTEGTSRERIHRKLGAPEETVAFAKPRRTPSGYGSLTSRRMVVSRIDTWPISGCDQLVPDTPTTYSHFSDFALEELTIGPLILVHWVAAQKTAKYRLHVAFDAHDACLGHSRVLVDGRGLQYYPPLVD